MYNRNPTNLLDLHCIVQSISGQERPDLGDKMMTNPNDLDVPGYNHDDDNDSDDDTDLEEVQGPCLAPVPGEGCGAGWVDAVDPVVELHLTRSLKYGNYRQ